MPAIRSAADIAKKWARVTPTRTEDYKSGIASPRRNWEEATAGAEDAYEAGVTKAMAKNRFGKGVHEAGFAKWQEKAKIKGGDRWGPGVSIAEPDYAKGFGPYRDIIESISLPPRYATGDPRNIERVKVIAMALRAAKVGK